VGDLIFLKLQPYVQSSLAPRANQKLAFKFFGPFPVLKKVGAGAYQLALPAESKIHPVFHVSQLKKSIGSNIQVPSTLPQELSAWQVPKKIMQHRLVNRGVNTVVQVLIKWSSLPESLATWEDLEAVQQQLPIAPAWGQAISLRGGGVQRGCL
jgi:hypothetical protein